MTWRESRSRPSCLCCPSQWHIQSISLPSSPSPFTLLVSIRLARSVKACFSPPCLCRSGFRTLVTKRDGSLPSSAEPHQPLASLLRIFAVARTLGAVDATGQLIAPISASVEQAHIEAILHLLESNRVVGDAGDSEMGGGCSRLRSEVLGPFFARAGVYNPCMNPLDVTIRISVIGARRKGHAIPHTERGCVWIAIWRDTDHLWGLVFCAGSK